MGHIFDRFVFVTNDHFFCFQDLNFLCVLNANLILVCAQNGTCAPCGSKIVVKESKLQTKSWNVLFGITILLETNAV
jgi:hypothetical protein